MTESEALTRLSVALGESDPTPTFRRTTWEYCKECRAEISPAMTAEDALTLCRMVGAKGGVSRSGFTPIPATNRCPYHPSPRGGR